MQQKKFLNASKFTKFKSFKTSAFLTKNFKKYRKNKSYFRNANFGKYLISEKKCTYKIVLLFKSNNFFCTLVNFPTNKVLYSISSGNYKINTC